MICLVTEKYDMYDLLGTQKKGIFSTDRFQKKKIHRIRQHAKTKNYRTGPNG